MEFDRLGLFRSRGLMVESARVDVSLVETTLDYFLCRSNCPMPGILVVLDVSIEGPWMASDIVIP